MPIFRGNGIHLRTVIVNAEDGLSVLQLQCALEHVGSADEGGHKHVGRPLVDALGVADVLDDTRIHNRNPVGDGHCLLLIVGDVDACDAHIVLDVFDDGAHLHTQLGVQVGERFVH